MIVFLWPVSARSCHSPTLKPQHDCRRLVVREGARQHYGQTAQYYCISHHGVFPSGEYIVQFETRDPSTACESQLNHIEHTQHSRDCTLGSRSLERVTPSAIQTPLDYYMYTPA